MASFTKAISIWSVQRLHDAHAGPFEHVIKVDLLPPSPTRSTCEDGFMSIKHQLAIAAAKELGLLDVQEYNSLKQEYEAQQYFSYGAYDASSILDHYRVTKLFRPISKQLSNKRYLLVVENLQRPIEPSSFTVDVGLPPPR